MNKSKLLMLFSIFCLVVMVPVAYAGGNDTVISADSPIENLTVSDDDILSANSYYFDSSVENDTGDGSIDNPYRDLKNARIKDGSTLYFADGEYTLDKYCSINKLTIIGSNASNTTLKFSKLRLALTASSSLTLKNITLANFRIECDGTLKATNTIFNDTYTSYQNQGGAITASTKTASVNLKNCTFINNYAPKGGAISVTSGNLTISNSRFIANHASRGGAIYIKGGLLTISNSIFTGNHADLYAGSIFCDNNVKVVIKKSKFLNGYCNDDAAGAIYLIESDLNATDLEINNCSSVFGGAIVSLKSSLILNNFRAINNSATYYGGAIFAMYHEFSICNSTLTNNSALMGGALYVSDVDSFLIKFNVFADNTDIAIYSVGSDTYYDSILDPALNNTFSNNGVYESSIPDLFIGNGDYCLLKYNSSYVGSIPRSYDLRDYDYVTPVKNQARGGNCWAFAAIAALESCLLKATGISYDLSEENMKNLMSLYSDYGWSMDPNVGGYDKMAMGYLTSWLGPVNESEDAYADSSILSPIFSSFMHIQNIAYLTRTSYTDNDAIKKAILDYGAVSTSIYWDTTYLSGNNYYNNKNTGANHAVAIVGWDDKYSRDNFKEKPAGDGAWIIKNSWGTADGEKGYYYVSYYDVRCAPLNRPTATFTFILNDTMKFDKNYQYDIPGPTDYFINSSNVVWYKNKFTATGNEYLAAVSTYFEKDTNWQLSVYVNSKLKLTQSGFSTSSYRTIYLDKLIILNQGDVFEVVFKISVKNEAGVPISERISLNYEFYSKGISYISYDGKKWVDFYELAWKYPDHTYDSQVACIKAFTFFDKLDTQVTLTVADDYNPVCVEARVHDQYGNLVKSGRVKFIMGNVSVNVDIKNGVARLDYLFENPTDNFIEAVFSGDGYNGNSSNVTTNARAVCLYADDMKTHTGQSTYVATLLDEMNNTVINKELKFTIANSVYTAVTNKYGQASITFKLDEGIYNMEVGFNDLSKNTDFNLNRTVTVISTITLPTSMKYTYNSYYSAYLMDGNGNPLASRNANILIASKTYSLMTDAKGYIKYNLKLSQGSYKVAVVNLETGESKSQTIKIGVRLSGSGKIVMYYGAGKNYKVRAFDDNGNVAKNVKVAINFNRKTYYRYTDSNGYAYLKLSANPNTYTITAAYKGFKVSSKVVIKPTLLMNNKVVKKSKTFRYNVKLLSSNGKILKNKKVTLKYRGKTYGVKTNAKGIATFKLKSFSRVGKFNIGAIYGKAKMVKTITVKR